MPQHDVCIVGGGPAGLTAALYCTRAGLDTVVLEYQVPGGQIATTDRVENYPGLGKTTGPELAASLVRDALSFGAELRAERATGIDLASAFSVTTSSSKVTAPAVIVASGARPRELGVQGEDRLRGRGISYCATCDAAFFREAAVAVVGGGDSAVQEALFLARFARSVTIIHRRDQLRAVKALQERAEAEAKISFAWNSVVTELHGEQELEGLVVRDVETGAERTLEVAGLFVYVGTIPNTEFLPHEVALDPAGYIQVDEQLMTSVPGIFAAGDVRPKSLRQVVTATGDGASAAMAASHYLDGR